MNELDLTTKIEGLKKAIAEHNDFAGTYTKIVPNELIEYVFDNRSASVEFMQTNNGVKVRITFVAETEHTIEQQEEGWQAILNKFAKQVEAKK